MTSPPFIVPIARQVSRVTLLVTKRTLPSPIRQLTPLGRALESGTCIAMLAMFPGKPMPANVTVLGTLRWLYVVQHISPMTQLAPCLLVSGVAVLGFSPVQAAKVAARLSVLGMVSMSVRGLGVPLPRSFSLNITVLL